MLSSNLSLHCPVCRSCGMDGRRIEYRQHAGRLVYQQAYLSAAQNQALRPLPLKVLNDLLVRLPRLILDDAHAQLVVNDVVHRLHALVVRHHHLEAKLVLQPGLVKVLLHGKPRAEQGDLAEPRLDNTLCRRVGNVNQGNAGSRLDTACGEVHRVGAQHNGIGSCGAELGSGVFQHRGQCVPFACVLKGLDLGKVKRVQKAFRR